MKVITFFFFLLITTFSYGQDSLKLKAIDQEVAQIELSQLYSYKDSMYTNKEVPNPFDKTDTIPIAKTKTWFSLTFIYTEKKELRKLIIKNYVIGTVQGKTDTSNSVSTFYYSEKDLIKVTEGIIFNSYTTTWQFYYSGNNFFYSKPDDEKVASRAAFLTNLSNRYRTAFNQYILANKLQVESTGYSPGL